MSKRTRRPETKEEAIARLGRRIADKNAEANKATQNGFPYVAAEYRLQALSAERALKTLRETCRLIEPR